MLKVQWLPIIFKVTAKVLTVACKALNNLFCPTPQILALTLPIAHFITSTLTPVSQTRQELRTYAFVVPLLETLFAPLGKYTLTS